MAQACPSLQEETPFLLPWGQFFKGSWGGVVLGCRAERWAGGEKPRSGWHQELGDLGLPLPWP